MRPNWQQQDAAAGASTESTLPQAPVARPSRFPYHDSIHTAIFTPAEYQLELLDAAKRQDIVVCLASAVGKTFTVVMLIKELAYQVRGSADTAKRSVVLANTGSAVKRYAQVIRDHTDLLVAEAYKADCPDQDAGYLESLLKDHQVLVASTDFFATSLDRLDLSGINLLAIDECHLSLQGHSSRDVLRELSARRLREDPCPRMLGLSASVLLSQCGPRTLERRLRRLERITGCTAETSGTITSLGRTSGSSRVRGFSIGGSAGVSGESARTTETVAECGRREESPLDREIRDAVSSARAFLLDHRYRPEDIYGMFEEDISSIPDPTKEPLRFLDELLRVLDGLGPWCAERAAWFFMKELKKHKDKVPYERHYLLLAVVFTVMESVRAICDYYFRDLEEVDRVYRFSTPRVLRLLDVLKLYSPPPKEGAGADCVPSSESTTVDNVVATVPSEVVQRVPNAVFPPQFRQEQVNGPSNARSGWRFRGRYRGAPSDRPPLPRPVHDQEDADSLWGIVFVEHRYTACVLNMLLKEMSRRHPQLRFLCPNFIMGRRNGVFDDSQEAQLEHRKQEEVLRRFRMHECNLLLATGSVDDSVDLPRCNLVVRLDPPNDFRSYAQSKGRARATRSHFLTLLDQALTEQYLPQLAQFKVTEEILLKRCLCRETPVDEEVDMKVADQSLPPFIPDPSNPNVAARLSNSIAITNRYCAKLPSDTFTRLVPRCRVETLEQGTAFRAIIELPVNSPVRKPIKGPSMPSRALAKMAAAQTVCSVLFEAGELDKNLAPLGKTSVKFEEELVEPWEEEVVAEGAPRPGTTKRRQYYNKRTAEAFTACQPKVGTPSFLYSIRMKLTCPIPEEQNIRGRRIYAPEETTQGFGILTAKEIPKLCGFPVFTRSGEVRVELQRLPGVVVLDKDQLEHVSDFHRYTFSNVLRLDKYPMRYDSQSAENSLFIVPLNCSTGDGNLELDWSFLRTIRAAGSQGPCPVSESERSSMRFDASKFRDAVVTPWYRNLDQPQYFYVAEICHHLHPRSDFPDDEFETFEKYYFNKYGIRVQDLGQPLLDVDHTSARLNLLTPRYVNRKGVALPTGSEETKRAKRENLQQKQILVPELCAVHPFPATLWRKAVCLPCVLYRANCLLLAEQLRVRVAREIGLGTVDLGPSHSWPVLNFGWSLADAFMAQNASKELPKPVKAPEPPAPSPVVTRVPEVTYPSPGLIRDGIEGVLLSRNCRKDRPDPPRPPKIENGPTSGFSIGTWSNDMMGSENQNEDEDDECASMLDDLTFFINDDGIHVDGLLDKQETPARNNNQHQNLNGHVETGNRQVEESLPKSEVSDSDGQQIRYGSPSNFEMTGWDLDNEFNVADIPGFGLLSLSGGGFNAEDLSRDLGELDGGSYSDDDEDDAEEDTEDDGGGGGGGGAEDSSRNGFGHWGDDNGDHGPSRDDAENKMEEFRWETSSTEEDDDDQDGPSSQEILDRIAEKKQAINFIPAGSELHLRTAWDKEEAQQLAGKTQKPPEQPESGCTAGQQTCDRLPVEVGDLKTEEDFDDFEQKDGNEFSFDWQPSLKSHSGPSPSVLLQSLTMSNANDGINLERLETIGDSFLKHAITTYLFCTYPTVHEGKLSYLRSKQVSNLKLYRLGRHKELGHFMIATKFEPNDNWLPPGYVVPKELEQALIESGIPAGYWNIANLPKLNEWGGVDPEEIRKALAGYASMLGDRENLSQKDRDEVDSQLEQTCFIPYNLMTQHSIPDKSIADCVEALIGAYLTSCGPRGALLFMSWLGIRVLPRARTHSGFGRLKAPAPPSVDVEDAVDRLGLLLDGYDAFEEKIGYRFRDRSYLLQAFTHASYHYNRSTDCYQRLEFLGDAVLDYLITRHLFEDSRQHSPGTLTDLRSALVNNTIFASLAVKYDFHKYFKSLCPGLAVVIDRFVKMQQDNNHRLTEEYYFIEEDECEDVEDIEVPKALGDVFESVAGAIYLDSGMSLDAIWRVYYAMMKSEIEQFSTNVPKSPIRELLEMEPETAKFGKPERTLDGKVRVTVEVFGKGRFSALGRNYRIAKCTAAKHALKALKKNARASVKQP